MIKSILFSHLRSSAFICGLYILISGCGGSQSNEVVLYTSVDEPIARQRIRVMVVGGIPTGPDLGPTTQPWVFTSINDLKAKNLSGKIAIARPTAGMTGGHVAALYTL